LHHLIKESLHQEPDQEPGQKPGQEPSQLQWVRRYLSLAYLYHYYSGSSPVRLISDRYLQVQVQVRA
jgi:hypothetical protein